MPQVPVDTELTAPPTESEVTTAIKHLPSGKAPGSDSIPAEISKAGGPGMTEKLTVVVHPHVGTRIHPTGPEGPHNCSSVQEEGQLTVM